MNKQKKGFTLVELIVVITILAILGTIAFLAFQGYSASARDSKRIADMNTIKTSLELFGLNSGKFPDPASPVMITYSSGTINDLNLRQQGIFGQQNVTNVSSAGKLDRLPKDPLTELEYTYSTTLNKKEFELGTILENDEVAFSPVNLANAATKKVVSAFIKGNYNGKILKTSSGTTSYIFAVPSIINSDSTLTNINELIFPINKIAYNGFANLPASYDGPVFEVNGAPNKKFVNPNEILVFSGSSYTDLINPEDSTTRIQLLKDIKDAYSGTDIAQQGGIKEIVNLEISDPSNPTPSEINNAAYLINDEFDTEIKLVPETSTGNIDDGEDDGETLVCTDMEQSNIDILNDLGGFEYTEEEWCELTELDLGESLLNSLPDEIGYLTNLQILWLYDNELTTLPSTITNLNNLTEIYLSGNNFTNFPEILTNLTNLETIYFNDNKLTNLPNTLNLLTNLKTINLGNNNFTIIPNIIYTLTNLDELGFGNDSSLETLNKNSITGISSNISNLINLTTLDLSGNIGLGNLGDFFNIRNINSAEGISNDGKLISISSGGGEGAHVIITSSVLAECDGLTQEVANTLNNTFGFDYSINMWCNLKTLTFIGESGGGEAVFNNDLLFTNISLFKKTFADGVDPYESESVCGGTHYNPGGGSWRTDDTDCESSSICDYTGTINSEFCGKNDGCDCWWGEGEIGGEEESELNILTSIPSEIGYLKNLTKITLNNNQITTLPSEFGNLTNLVELNLNDNQINILPNEIGNLINLKYLYLDHNDLTTIPSNIGNLTNLYVMTIESNNLESIPNEIGFLTNLVRLELGRNENYLSLPNTLSSLINLKNLSLNSNKLTTLPNSIWNLTNLTSLRLDYNNLTTISSDIGNLTKLITLDLEANDITEIPDEIGNLTNLWTLLLGSNELSSIPNEIGNLSKLYNLDIRRNNIPTLPDEFCNLSELIFLNLDGAGLTSLPENFGNLSKLSHLYLGGNDLISLPTNFGNLINLTRLDLGGVGLTKLPNSFSNLTKLTYLRLIYNTNLYNLSNDFTSTTSLTRTQINITPDGKTMKIQAGGGSIIITVY